MFWIFSLLRAKGFSLDDLYGGLGINKLHFLIKKDKLCGRNFYFLMIQPYTRLLGTVACTARLKTSVGGP